MVAAGTEVLGVLVTPLLLLTAAGLGLWSMAVALQWAIVVLVITLLVIGYLATWKLELTFRHKAAIVFADVVLSLLVIGLELLAKNIRTWSGGRCSKRCHAFRLMVADRIGEQLARAREEEQRLIAVAEERHAWQL